MLAQRGKTPAIDVTYSEISFCRRWGDEIGDYDSETAKIDLIHQEPRRAEEKETEDRIRLHPELTTQIREREKRSHEHDSPPKFAGVIAPDTLFPASWGGRGCPDRDNSKFPKNWPETTVVLGKISYRDIFKGTPIHSTEFCLERVKGNALTLCSQGQSMK
jgi:hypothetical protein